MSNKVDVFGRFKTHDSKNPRTWEELAEQVRATTEFKHVSHGPLLHAVFAIAPATGASETEDIQKAFDVLERAIASGQLAMSYARKAVKGKNARRHPRCALCNAIMSWATVARAYYDRAIGPLVAQCGGIDPQKLWMWCVNHARGGGAQKYCLSCSNTRSTVNEATTRNLPKSFGNSLCLASRITKLKA